MKYEQSILRILIGVLIFTVVLVIAVTWNWHMEEKEHQAIKAYQTCHDFLEREDDECITLLGKFNYEIQ